MTEATTTTTTSESETPGRDLIEALKRKRPEVVFSVERQRDTDPEWHGDPDEHPAAAGGICYEWTVTATAIQLGEYVEGEAHLGGSWYHPEDRGVAYQEVSGYLQGMVTEALKELDAKLATRPAYSWKCDQ